MSDTDKVIFTTLATFLITLLGWIFTFMNERTTRKEQRHMQQELVSLQEQFTRNRETRQYLVPKQLEELENITEWFHQGFKLYNDSKIMNRWPKKIPQGGQEEAMLNTFVEDWKKWRDDSLPNVSVARQIESLDVPNPPWQWGTQPIPQHLPTIMAYFMLDIQDRISETLEPEKAPAHPKVEGQSIDLYKAGVDAIKRLREHIVTQNS
jgi:hypothetical protein